MVNGNLGSFLNRVYKSTVVSFASTTLTMVCFSAEVILAHGYNVLREERGIVPGVCVCGGKEGRKETEPIFLKLAGNLLEIHREPVCTNLNYN